MYEHYICFIFLSILFTSTAGKSADYDRGKYTSYDQINWVNAFSTLQHNRNKKRDAHVFSDEKEVYIFNNGICERALYS